jgi:hypothetical protein
VRKLVAPIIFIFRLLSSTRIERRQYMHDPLSASYIVADSHAPNFSSLEWLERVAHADTTRLDNLAVDAEEDRAVTLALAAVALDQP